MKTARPNRATSKHTFSTHREHSKIGNLIFSGILLITLHIKSSAVDYMCDIEISAKSNI